MPRELGSRTYLWMGAGTLALGIGAALASGAGIAQADSTSSSSSGPSKPAHHQAAASPSHSTASTVKSSATKKKSSVARQAATNQPGVVSTAVAVHVVKTGKATAAADNPSDVAQTVAAQSQAIIVQGQHIATQGQAIADEEKAFGTQVQNFLTTTNFVALPPKGFLTEFYYGVTAATLLEFGQMTNGIARGLNEVAQGVTALETGILSRTEPGSSFTIAAYTAITPIANVVKSGATIVENASVNFWVTAGAYESGFIHNLPPR